MTKQEFLSAKFANELQFSAAFHRYVNFNYPDLRHFYAHIPNENSHKLLVVGVLPGYPDFVFHKPFCFHIELKMPNGTLSPKQKQLHSLWIDAGMKVFTCYNANDCVGVLKSIIK